MLQKEFRYAFMILGFLVVVLIGLHPVISWATLEINAVHLFGTGIIAVIVQFEIIAPILRGYSPQIITCLGHFPIRKKDVFHIDGWSVFCTGSIDVDKVWTGPGNKTHPVLVFPSYHETPIEYNYVCWTILSPFLIDQINPKIVRTVNEKYPGRIDEKTPILSGLVSYIDFSDNAENIDFEEQLRMTNENYNSLEQTNSKLREQLKKNSDMKKPGVMKVFQSKGNEYE